MDRDGALVRPELLAILPLLPGATNMHRAAPGMLTSAAALF